MNVISEVALAFWHKAAERMRPLHEALSGRVTDEGYTGLANKLTRNEIESESGSMDEELAMLKDLL